VKLSYHTNKDRPDDLQQFLRQAEAFAVNEYAPSLHKGFSASVAERQKVLAGMERFTDVSADYWDKANLRIGESQFAKELLRDRGKLLGRIDSKFVGDFFSGIAEVSGYDPFSPSVGAAFSAAFNDYYREEFGVKTDRKYVTSGGLWTNWDERHAQPAFKWGQLAFANTGIDLSHAMIQNPKIRLLAQQGYFDLATPYCPTDYFLNQMETSKAPRKNITLEMYEAGHMMYLHSESLIKFGKDLSDFVD
jgi:carboxypeptidase C (cathepsin A)